MIRGDASLAYQDLADVLSACDEAGIRNVRLPVRSREDGKPVRLVSKPPDRIRNADPCITPGG